MLADRRWKRHDGPSFVRLVFPAALEVVYCGLPVPFPYLVLPGRVDIERLVVFDPAAHGGIVRAVERYLVAVRVSEDPVLGMEVSPRFGVGQEPLAVHRDADTDFQAVVLHHPGEYR